MEYVQIGLCGAAGLMTIISYVLFSRGRDGWSIMALVAAALLLRLAINSVDLFLHPWDERFHALVAKHMMHDPFKPILRLEPIMEYDYRSWCCNHVWLHKQPLFLWQMALSMKLFGVNETALRLPSALLGSLALWPVYRIGALAFRREVGYFAAVLGAFGYYALRLTSGQLGMDHNDIAFMSYTTASVWAYYEARVSPRPWRWIVLVGVFAGAAVLCKWLTGLAVYAGWGLDVLLSPERRRQLREYLRPLASFGVALLVLLPWQLYTQWRFPLESSFERAYNTKHFTEVVENRSGDWQFYFLQLQEQYSWFVPLLVLGLVLALTLQRSQRVTPLLTVIATVFVFFTVAATKMPNYIFVLAPLLWTLIALALWQLLHWLTRWLPQLRPVLGAVFMLLAVGLALQPAELLDAVVYRDEVGEGELTRSIHTQNTDVYRQLNDLVPPGYVVINAPSFQDLEAMFYSDRNVYAFYPDEAHYQALKAKGYRFAAFINPSSRMLPPYIENDPTVLRIWGDVQ